MNAPTIEPVTEYTYQLTADEKQDALDRAHKLLEKLERRHASHESAQSAPANESTD